MLYIVRVVISLRDKEAHDWHRQPADGMQKKDARIQRISRENDGGQMVDSHGNDGNEF